MKMITITLFIVVLLLIPLFSEMSSHSVYGRTLKEEELVAFLDKHLASYDVNDISWRGGRVMLTGRSMDTIHLPYIAKGCGSFFREWHISEYGCVSRWSPSATRIQTYFDSLTKPERNPLELSDL